MGLNSAKTKGRRAIKLWHKLLERCWEMLVNVIRPSEFASWSLSNLGTYLPRD